MPKASRHGDRKQFWRGLIDRHKRSGQSIREFCDSQGVSQPSFYTWRRKLAAADERPPEFVPIKVVDDIGNSQSRIEIVLSNARRIRVEPGFDAQALRDVLCVLEDSSC